MAGRSNGSRARGACACRISLTIYWEAGSCRLIAMLPSLAAHRALKDIDAMTVTPRLGRSRIRYSRLIIPVQTPWGERCLLGTGVIDVGINLRLNTRSDA